MKKIVVFFLLGIFISPFIVQSQTQSLDQKKFIYEKKVISFTKMKQTGAGLTFGGVVLSVAGIAIMVDGAKTYVNDDSYSSTDDYPAKFYLGYLATVVGVASTTGGIVLWSIGSNKAKSYQKRIDSLSLNLNPGQRQIFSLAYRF